MNILLLTDIPPCSNFTGGIVLEQLTRFLIEDGHNVSCFAIVHPDLAPVISEDISQHMAYKRVDKPKESWGIHPRIGGLASIVGNNYVAATQLPKLASRAASFAKENNADIIWSTIQGQTMIKVVRRAAQLANIPYTAQVWDPPEWWLAENKFDRYTQRSVMKEFGNLLHHSQACMAASWSMAEAYAQEFQANCVPVVPGLDDAYDIQPAVRANNNEFIIAFAGQIYAATEFNALVAALEHMNWKYNERDIKLVLYGRYFNHFNFNKPSNLMIRGWLDQDEVLKELAAADLLYCPYWFSSSFEKIARLSFPSKLTSYLRTKRPVLIHAPEYASPNRFIKQYKAGYVCETLSPPEISNLLEEIISDEERTQIGVSGFKAFIEHLTFKTMKSSFYKALGIKER